MPAGERRSVPDGLPLSVGKRGRHSDNGFVDMLVENPCRIVQKLAEQQSDKLLRHIEALVHAHTHTVVRPTLYTVRNPLRLLRSYVLIGTA